MNLLDHLLKKKRPIEIQFCVTNLDRYLTDDAQEQLTELVSNGKVKIKEYECLSYCERCKGTFYALVDGEFVGGDPNKVIQKIIAHTQ
jgi:uncharacterized protein YuzB (UPF0349 family)